MQPQSLEHVVVYRDENYFSAWPFNGGFWQFADGELAVGFVRGRCDYRKPETLDHGEVDVKHGEHVILRSADGGRTWPVGTLTRVYQRPAFDEQVAALPVSFHSERRYDPSADGYCLLSGFGIPPEAKPHALFTMVSTDRGQTWSEPIRLPMGRLSQDAFRELGGRPSYVLRGDGMLLLFAHGMRGVEHERPSVARPVVYGSRTGGASWGLIGEVELTPPQPMGIMPYPLLLRDGAILIAVRRQYDVHNTYTQVYASTDGGRSWSFRSRVNDWGAPANLVELPDGRIVCVYGYRQRPYGIRACVSTDAGHAWGAEIVLRADGGGWDLGYPRTLLRPDGSLITVYYHHTADGAADRGGVRHIAATLWRV